MKHAFNWLILLVKLIFLNLKKKSKQYNTTQSTTDLPETQDLRLCMTMDTESNSNGIMNDQKCVSKNDLSFTTNDIQQICWDYGHFDFS